ncbi:hypothetical protein EMCRGX_G024613 [Ephydatia muelleri]
MGSIAESDRCSVVRTRNRTVALLFNQKTACRTMFSRATSRATVPLFTSSEKESVNCHHASEYLPAALAATQCSCKSDFDPHRDPIRAMAAAITQERARQYTHELVDHLNHTLRDNTKITPSEVIVGGSLGQGTAVLGKFDIDLVIYTRGTKNASLTGQRKFLVQNVHKHHKMNIIWDRPGIRKLVPPYYLRKEYSSLLPSRPHILDPANPSSNMYVCGFKSSTSFSYHDGINGKWG